MTRVTRALVSRPAGWSVAAAAAALALAGCGGDDDAAESTTTTSLVVAESTTTTAPPTPAVTQPPTTASATPTSLVTAGAIVVVANASTVNGAAGRMTDELAAAGFETGTATNSSEDLATTKVYFNASIPEAQAVAESVVAALGGGTIVAEPLPTPAPLEDPESIGEATVLVALGEDAADMTLAQLQGGGATTASSTPSSADSTTPPTSAG